MAKGKGQHQKKPASPHGASADDKRAATANREVDDLPGDGSSFAATDPPTIEFAPDSGNGGPSVERKPHGDASGGLNRLQADAELAVMQADVASEETGVSDPRGAVPTTLAAFNSKPEDDWVDAIRDPRERRGTAIAAADQQDADSSEPEAARRNRFLFLAAIPSWLISMIVHVVVLMVLAWLTLPMRPADPESELTLGESEVVELVETPVFDDKIEDLEPLELDELVPTDSAPVTNDLPEVSAESLDVGELQVSAPIVALNPLGDKVAPMTELLTEVGAVSGVGFDGRSDNVRARLVRDGGGTPQSEKAVELALKWFQRHQHRDGSWNFRPGCKCGDPGRLDIALNGATAMALLPFLGAGNTHMEGQYQKEVRAGLYFLLNRQQANGALIDPGGNLYSHGLCAITLCEAYAMTQDPALARPAQAALDYITYAQDPVGGGWRYVARQPGDTSAVGWQLMALKSGRMAYLNVNPGVFVGATRFLDSVQTDEGAAYGYKDPGDRVSTTAIGLLCRMYLGWGREEPALRRGVARIAKSGHSDVDMYYNYYATQVMRHYEGEEWEKWNEEMRDFLVKNQATKGHEEGSWHMGASHAASTGGRLYNTSMATMVLEVYYRHMPLYRKQVVDDEFEF